MAGAHQIHPHRLLRADQVTQRLLLGAGHPDRMSLPINSSRTRCSASRRSVLTRFPDAREIFDGPATMHSTPRRASSRASPYLPFVGPPLVVDRRTGPVKHPGALAPLIAIGMAAAVVRCSLSDQTIAS